MEDSARKLLQDNLIACVFCDKDPKVSLLMMGEGHILIEIHCGCGGAFIAHTCAVTIDTDIPILINGWNQRVYQRS